MAAAGSAGHERLKYAFFLIPATIFLFALAGYPFVDLIRMSLSNVSASNIVHGAWPLIGFDTFGKLFLLAEFGQAFGNTLVYVLIVVVMRMVGGLCAAVILQQRSRLAGFGIGLMVFTWAMPPVVPGSLWKFLLLPHGLVNAVFTLAVVVVLAVVYVRAMKRTENM